ncbi:hypothetical protein FB567DRAFT_556016 [Paraphoma chrysanthemicola]|uniref:Uncharacterized protein n=1 Tax=Paraphoma chrysanthemicola TaxID=798071 RepID=A0A8K0RFH7_9PLEO|nr:hypothetical protein FB567DRAFT_556016 [Paraphoma chrysanthemicola]
MDNSNSDEFGEMKKEYRESVLSSVLSTDPSPSDIVGDCMSEACSWQPYTSLAVCASIEDISSRGVMYNNSQGYPNLRIAGANWQPPSQELSGTDIFWMAAPVGDPGNLTTARPTAITEIYVAYYPACNSTNQPRQGVGEEMTEPRRNASNWKVFKGTLSACVQTLNSTYNNSMTTTIIDTQRDLNWTRDLLTHYKGEEFHISQKELDQWAALFERTLKGAAMLCEGCDNYYKGQWVPVIVNEIIGPTPWKCDPSLGLDYGLKGFTRRLNNIAISLSNSMRTQTSDGVLPLSVVQGTAWTSEQYISVDFRWMSLPCGIYLIITSFLLATIWKSRRQDIPLWKSSPLVLLQAADQHNGLQSLRSVDKNAKKHDVQLKYTGENWYLRDVTEKQHMQG